MTSSTAPTPADRPVILAAGGTGGHLFPAFALAEELGRRGRAVELATDMRGDRYGTGFPARKVHQIPSATLAGRDPLAMTKTALTLSQGVASAYRLLGSVKPLAVVGFGGYPSFPPLLAARMRGIPSALHEQNAVLGRANRMLAKRVTLIATSFRTVKFLDGGLEAKARFTGNPVRSQVLAVAGHPYAEPGANERIHMVVFGGSQGARFFSDTVPAALAGLNEGIRWRLAVTQQAREEDVERVRAAYAAAGIVADIAPFFRDLPERMANSHLVIARAGASSVAELAVLGRPSILVPLPHALDNDQLQNATELQSAGGAWCLPQSEASPERFTRDIERLFGTPGILATAAAAARQQGRADAAVELANLVDQLIAGHA